MKRTASQKTAQTTTASADAQTAAGPAGAALTPPAYGMEAADGQALWGAAMGLSAPSAPRIQRKALSLGPADDPYEREADRVARQVVGQIGSPAAPGLAQGQGAPAGVQRVAAISPLTATAGTTPIDAGVQRAIDGARGGGQLLPEGLRAPMERAMGADFGGVRLHTDARADALNHALQARAFTTGQDVFFSRGTYAPGSRSGQETIAHELAHVVQQNGNVAAPHVPGHQLSPSSTIQRRFTGDLVGKDLNWFRGLISDLMVSEFNDLEMVFKEFPNIEKFKSALLIRREIKEQVKRAGISEQMQPAAITQTFARRLGATENQQFPFSSAEQAFGKLAVQMHLDQFPRSHAFVPFKIFKKIKKGDLPTWGVGSNFVSPLVDAERILDKAKDNEAKLKGDGIRTIEQELSVPIGSWSMDEPGVTVSEIFRFIVQKPKDLGLRMPMGAERGAYQNEWVFGGKTLKGTPEAVIDVVTRDKLIESLKQGPEGPVQIKSVKFDGKNTVEKSVNPDDFPIKANT